MSVIPSFQVRKQFSATSQIVGLYLRLDTFISDGGLLLVS